MQDLYETLGVGRNADGAAIKSAYRKLAMKYHPDRNPDNAEAEAKFKEVGAAYEILKDKQKRGMYDAHGVAAFENGSADHGGVGGFRDIFEEMFGGSFGGQQARSNRGADVRVNMIISLKDAYTGVEKEIEIPIKSHCTVCSGYGTGNGSAPNACEQCHGRGKMRMQQGIFSIEQTCPICRGCGYLISDPCRICRGSGLEKKQQKLSVNIPAGIEEGQRIRLTGRGEAGYQGTSPGDLYVFIRVAEHKLFERDGAHLHCEIPISMVDASLGTSMEIPLPTGKRVQVKIPAGTQTGTQLRLRGKGMPVMRREQFGDLFVHTRVETPVNLTKRQTELLEEFCNENTTNSPESQSFVDKVKNFLKS